MKNQEEKEVGYCYPSSCNAVQLGFGETGCFHVGVRKHNARIKLLGGYLTKDEALVAADKLPMSYGKYSMQRDKERKLATPGPWYYRPDGPAMVEAQNKQGYNLLIADCGQSYVTEANEAQANARLIAAAPELLEACHEALLEISVPGEPNDSETVRVKQLIQAAIAKATGGA